MISSHTQSLSSLNIMPDQNWDEDELEEIPSERMNPTLVRPSFTPKLLTSLKPIQQQLLSSLSRNKAIFEAKMLEKKRNSKVAKQLNSNQTSRLMQSVQEVQAPTVPVETGEKQTQLINRLLDIVETQNTNLRQLPNSSVCTQGAQTTQPIVINNVMKHPQQESIRIFEEYENQMSRIVQGQRHGKTPKTSNLYSRLPNRHNTNSKLKIQESVVTKQRPIPMSGEPIFTDPVSSRQFSRIDREPQENEGPFQIGSLNDPDESYPPPQSGRCRDFEQYSHRNKNINRGQNLNSQIRPICRKLQAATPTSDEVTLVSLQTKENLSPDQAFHVKANNLKAVSNSEVLQKVQGTTKPETRASNYVNFPKAVLIQIPLQGNENQTEKISLSEAFAKRMKGSLGKDRGSVSVASLKPPVFARPALSQRSKQAYNSQSANKHEKGGKADQNTEISIKKADKQPSGELIDRLIYGVRAKVSRQEMLKLTKKNYEKLPEVKAKIKEQEKKAQEQQRLQRIRDYQKQLRSPKASISSSKIRATMLSKPE